MKIAEPRYIDRPWKITFWIYGIYALLRAPFRLVRISSETLDFVLAAHVLIFIAAIFLAGVLYVRTTKKGVDRHTKLRVALYVTLISLAGVLLIRVVSSELFQHLVGGVLEAALTLAATFATVYLVLPLGSHFRKK